MGGTDQMDQNLGCYRIGVRGKKWYWPLVTWMFDVAMQNSWILYKKTGRQKKSQLEFRREVVNVYLEKYKNAPTGSGRISKSIYSSDSRISVTLRFDKTDHLVQHTEEKKKRCAGINCNSAVRTMCSKCSVGLCIDCFKPFLSK